MKTKSALALFGALTVSALSIGLARADDSCADQAAEIAALKQRVAAIDRRFDQVRPNMPGGVTLGPIVRNANGSVKRMTYKQAVSYCATRGGLPTSRQLAMALNPSGISDREREGFPKVSPKNEPDFYYNYGSYERPAGDEGSEWFWSSSVNSDGYSFVFNGFYGFIDYAYRINYVAVRCAGR